MDSSERILSAQAESIPLWWSPFSTLAHLQVLQPGRDSAPLSCSCLELAVCTYPVGSNIVSKSLSRKPSQADLEERVSFSVPLFSAESGGKAPKAFQWLPGVPVLWEFFKFFRSSEVFPACVG